ncbi:hypothetical protein [Calothrix sp. 336/3]|uniref:hypothetical protein n=1 Tax=Calothrix sp. 336/3 TaxID=1337936 RepID=UPI00069B9023|nr:hypothetical protein [Calothrix sp. 336/3]
MSNILNSLQSVLIWCLFFATSVYGHVALKLAVGESESPNAKHLWLSAISFWGWSAWISWGASAVLWMVVVSKQPLLTASSISALRYVLICLSAWLILRDTISPRELIGVFCITLGIFLVAR